MSHFATTASTGSSSKGERESAEPRRLAGNPARGGEQVFELY
jgi:hypothetical protein